MTTAAPTAAGARIMLIHALRESQVPIWDAFAAGWPEARIFNLLDDSLSADLAATGRLDAAMTERFLTLGRYAASVGAGGRQTDAILFTCSAFGPAIDAVKAAVPVPVLRPNEAAFERALEAGKRVGILVTFPPSLPALEAELRAMAKARGQAVDIEAAVVPDALAALQAGRPDEHDELIAKAAAALTGVDALVLGQFSMARAAARIAPLANRLVLTTPDTAVAKLRSLLGPAAS